MNKTVLFSRTGTVKGLYSDGDCVCCNGRHRYCTVYNWELTEQEIKNILSTLHF